VLRRAPRIGRQVAQLKDAAILEPGRQPYFALLPKNLGRTQIALARFLSAPGSSRQGEGGLLQRHASLPCSSITRSDLEEIIWTGERTTTRSVIAVGSSVASTGEQLNSDSS
jgi:hypothetical protein